MRYSIVWCVVAGLLACCGEFCEGKSVFAVASHGTSDVKVYKIDGTGLGFQATIEGTESFGAGATGLCVWADLELMFVTYEFSETIAWASTKTLSRDADDEINGPEANLAGIVANETDSLLYVVTRANGHLYTYTFDPVEDTLVLIHPRDPAYPERTYRQLEGLEQGATYGLALDEDGSSCLGVPCGRLYVADGTSTVRYYNTLTWDLEGSVNMGREMFGIDVDGSGYLYGGGYSKHDYLVRYDFLAAPNSPERLLEEGVGSQVTDVRIDRDTGLVYTTTRRPLGGERVGAVEVFDASGWVSSDPSTLILTDVETDDDFSGPAGIAVGPTYKAPRIFVEKVDDVNELSERVVPDDVVTYSITVRAGVLDETNVVVRDKLPLGLDFVSAEPNTGYWDSESRLYVWPAVNLPGYDPNTWQSGDPNAHCSLSVRVSDLAEPAADLENVVQAESDEAYTEAKEHTPVDCFGGDVIFVDQFATGSGSGTSWSNAYTTLQDALARAGKGCGDDIWVAQGLYSPGTDYDATFEVPAGVSVYGGFNGTETSLTERDLSKYKTILSGQTTNQVVVTMGRGASLDGLVIEEAYWHGVSGTNVPFSVMHCVVRNNRYSGVYCQDGRVSIAWSEVKDNGWYGVHVYSEQPEADRELKVFNSRIHGNQYDGIRAVSSTTEVRDSLIYGNGLGGEYFGLRLLQPVTGAVVHNNTIAHNNKEGIRFVGENRPDVRNCILWGNAGRQLSGLNEDTVYWCCIQDCNDINQGNNINDDPLFCYSQEPYGLYHLSADSPCIDGGDSTYVDPNSTGEWDIDGDDRIINDYVDIGADEFACEELTHSVDWTYDGIIDPAELVSFAAAWLSSDPNEPGITTDPNYIGQPQYRDPAFFVNWDGRCDLSGDYFVDLVDWGYFASYWRWRACWRDSGYGVWALGEGGMMQSMMQVDTLSMTTAGAITIADATPRVQSTITEEYTMAKEIVAWLEDFWENDAEAREAIDKKDWKEFMDQIYAWVADVEEKL